MESWLIFIYLLQGPHYRTRGRIRDGKCLITGMQTQTYSRLKVAHIFPRTHDVEVTTHIYHILIDLIPTPPQWVRKSYPSKITDMADEASMGGRMKIDCAERDYCTMRRFTRCMGQLRIWGRPERMFYSRIHIAPQYSHSAQNNYRITAFTNGNVDINGLNLQLDHIQDPTLRPLDELFTDHFFHAVCFQVYERRRRTGMDGRRL